MQKQDNSSPWITRRDLLAQSVRGAVLASMAPYLSHTQTLLGPDNSALRARESFDFGWKFLRGDASGAQAPKFADAGWRDVDLPHDWSIEGPFGKDETSGGPGGYLPTGIGWYRKSFRVPETDRERVVLLELDGVYQNSEVWINGQYLGHRPYGYVPFAYELTPYLNFGSENLYVLVGRLRMQNVHTSLRGVIATPIPSRSSFLQ